MNKKRIAQMAMDLVFDWDANRPDEQSRAALVEAVHKYLAPSASPHGTACAVNQGRARRRYGGGNYILPQTAEQLVQHLRMGLSIREVVRALGVSRGTVTRYERLNGPFTCPCGRERKHRGWCRERIKRSPLRQAFLSRWFGRPWAYKTPSAKPSVIIDRRIVDANWPYLAGKPGDGGALIDAVNAIVPRGFEPHARADICQDLLLAILEGEATIEKLRDGSAECIKRYYKLHPGKFGPLSLDAPIPGTEGMTLGNTIRSDAPHF